MTQKVSSHVCQEGELISCHGSALPGIPNAVCKTFLGVANGDRYKIVNWCKILQLDLCRMYDQGFPMMND